MVGFVTELLEAAIDGVAGSAVAILGVAYKGGVADTRESPAFTLIDTLETAGVRDIHLSDPYVKPGLIEQELLPLEESLEGADAAVIVTDHPEYGALDPAMFAERMDGRAIIDTRAILDVERWNAIGFDVYKI